MIATIEIVRLLSQPFLRNALTAGVAVSLLAGLVGYFVVLRAQVFAADALSHAAFTGTLAALAIGVEPRLGLFVATIGVALIIGFLGDRGRADDVVIGIAFAWVLGLGVLFLSIYAAGHSANNGSATTATLFGSIFGLSTAQTQLAVLVAVALITLLLIIARPLLFASLDEAVAAARNVPVRTLGVAFLALVGATAAEATQAVGALLLLGLIAAPAGAAVLITNRPFVGLAVSGGLAVGATVSGLLVSALLLICDLANKSNEWDVVRHEWPPSPNGRPTTERWRSAQASERNNFSSAARSGAPAVSG
jgi:zinc/manganese transport system permease protein